MVALVLSLAGCRPAPKVAPDRGDAATPEEAASASPVDAGLAVLAVESPGMSGDGGAAMAEAARPGPHSLPTAGRLVAPFRGTGAHGFVAVTAGPSSHLIAPLPGPGAPAAGADAAADVGTRPVLVASVTKLWTAVAALRMVERGELSLDATVRELLPELASRPWADSTVRELMSHTSRVPELENDPGHAASGTGYFRRADVDFSSPVVELSRSLSRHATEKRGVYKYRNAEYALVGTILAAVAGRPAAEVLAREVFEPAGMTTAGLLVSSRGGPSRDVKGLDMRPVGPIRPQNFFTAGAGYASARDLLSFFDALAGAALLAEASKTRLFAGDPGRGYHALGCWEYALPRSPRGIPEEGATRIVERPGSFGNVRLYTALFPEERRAVAVYTSDPLDIATPHRAVAKDGIVPALVRAALE